MFIIIEGLDNRYILYFRAQSTYELVASVDGKEKIISKLKQFCHRFRSKAEMYNYMRNYASSNTKEGIIFRAYFSQVEEEWNNIYKPVWEDVISEVISSSFIPVKFKRKNKFKVLI